MLNRAKFFLQKPLGYLAGVLFLVVVTRLQTVGSASVDNLGIILAQKLLVLDDLATVENELGTVEDLLVAKTADSNRFPTQTVMLGNLFWQVGERETAVSHWQQAQIEPEFFIGKIERLNQPSDLDYINRAIALAPTRSELLYYKGVYFEKNQGSAAAADWYVLAQEQDNWVGARIGFAAVFERARVLAAAQKWDEAEPVIHFGLQLSNQVTIDDMNQVAAMQRWLGLIAQGNGRITEAHTHFSTAIKLNPNDVWNYLSLALVLEAEESTVDVVFAAFDKAQTAVPQNIYAYTYPAKYYSDRKQFKRSAYFCDNTPPHLKSAQEWLDICQ